ncbi:hypothetical protein Pmani_020028 [Petrolisthes manimaculis]|uniref:Uncharacterized protein n=1 Tax=Petrolisthes manimaculis TaxID=1843537 RepID=A0AAE1PJ95_9EUCA|nr:hypothetical protein Pmani_020028 [Petrolisthes manimaculis]
MRLNVTRQSVEAASLSRLLVSMVQQDMVDCRLALIYDASDLYSVVVQDLMLLLPNPKQVHGLPHTKISLLNKVVKFDEVKDLLGVLWVSTGCGGYLLLLDHTQPLLTFANTHHHTWDYYGRFVIVSQSVKAVESFTATRNGKKTEHILGVVKVSTFEFAPSIMYYRSDDGSLLYRFGEDIAVTNTLASILNFTALFAEPADGNRWGWKVNGTWTGLLGELHRDETDIGLANLYITINRLGALDYSAPFSDDGSCFMARVEPPLPRWQALAFPFHPWTWLAILVGLILSGPILFLLAAASSRCGDETKYLAGLSASWHYSFGIHFREPQWSLPRMDNTRVFVLFLWLYTMILTIAYSTNLTAFLLVQKSPASIQTIDEVYDSGIQVAGIGAPLNGAKEECFMPFNIGMGLQRHSPLKRKFDEVIGWIQQSGILKIDVRRALRLAATTKEYGGKAEGQEEEEEGTVVALNVDHMQGVFMVAVIGWFIAIIVFILESFLSRN